MMQAPWRRAGRVGAASPGRPTHRPAWRAAALPAKRQQARMGTELLHRFRHPDDYNEKHDATHLMDAHLHTSTL